jgi:serine phosphatase RsbU (regulator of sigma subunit)
MAQVDCGLAMQALLEHESECGDIGIIKLYNKECFVALLDVLGHGAVARDLALLAQDYIEKHYCDDLVDILEGLHGLLRGSRGTVAALLHLDIPTGELCYTGIGNISLMIMRSTQTRLIIQDGIIGYIMPKPRSQKISLFPGDIVILHSDGIRDHFDLLECADLLSKSAQNIADELMMRFWKKNDDASVIVMKYNH